MIAEKNATLTLGEEGLEHVGVDQLALALPRSSGWTRKAKIVSA